MRSIFSRIGTIVSVPLGLFLFFSAFTPTYANIDQLLSKTVKYECGADGTGVLSIVINGAISTTYAYGEGDCLEWGVIPGKETAAYGCKKYSSGFTTKTFNVKRPLLVKKFVINHAGFVDTKSLLTGLGGYRTYTEALAKVLGVDEATFASFGYVWQNIFNIYGVDNFYVPGCGCPTETFTGTTEIKSLGTYLPIIELKNKTNTGNVISTTYIQVGEKEIERGKGIQVGSRFNGNYSAFVFISDVVSFKPIGNGIPESCEPGVCKIDNECRLTAETKQYNTAQTDIRIPVLSTYGTNTSSGVLRCANLQIPTVSCTAGTGASVLVTPVSLTKLTQPFIINIPQSIASQTGTCTIRYPATACQREKTETITISNSSCIPSGYTKQTCDIYLSQTKFPILTSGAYQNFSFSGITDNCQIDELIGKNVKFQCNNGAVANLPLRTETGTTGTGLSIRIPLVYLAKDRTCTLIYPDLACGPGGSQTITVGSGQTTSNSLCGNGVIEPEKGEECDLGTQNGKTSTGCTISCKLAPTTTPQCSPAYSGGTLLDPITTGYCGAGTATGFTDTLSGSTHIYSWQCTLTGKTDQSCDAKYTPPYCGDGKRNGSEACDPNDTIYKNGWDPVYGCSPTCTQGVACTIDNKPVCKLSLPTNILDLSDTAETVYLSGASTTCIIPDAPTVKCNNTETITVANTDTSRGLTPSFILPASVMSGSNSCVITYPANTCSSGSTGQLVIQETPTYLTGVTVTEKEVCFQILNSSQKPILGLEKTLTTTLTFGQNTYTGSTQKYLYSGSNTFDLSTVTYVDGKYCVDTPTNTGSTGGSGGGSGGGGSSGGGSSGAGGSGGGGAGSYPVGVSVSWCNDPQKCALTHPGGFLVMLKKCSGKIQVMSDGRWSDSDVLYDTNQEYAISVQGSNCNGTIKVTDGTNIFATGGTFVKAPTKLSSTGAFMAEIKKPTNVAPNTARGVSVYVTYTEPGGFSYGLTSDAGDWTDKPLTIIGNRMRGVRVIGSIAGMSGSTYNMNNENIITTASTYSTLLNSINTKVTTLIRSMTTGQVVNNVVYYRQSSLNYSEVSSLSFKTLIVYGNLVIDQNIENTKGIIVLKDTNGNGGNVIIADNVKNIHAIIFAEGILRGASTTPNTLNPSSQLILKGALYARNTIGGSADSSNLFLYPNVKTTDKTQAFLQDLNNVRSGIQTGESYLGYTDPFIIHYDSSFIQDPPPGF